MATPHARHQEVEARFRALLADADLPLPDEVEHHETQLVFLWHASKVAVAVELDRDDMDEFDDFEQAMIRGVPPRDWPIAG